MRQGGVFTCPSYVSWTHYYIWNTRGHSHTYMVSLRTWVISVSTCQSTEGARVRAYQTKLWLCVNHLPSRDVENKQHSWTGRMWSDSITCMYHTGHTGHVSVTVTTQSHGVMPCGVCYGLIMEGKDYVDSRNRHGCLIIQSTTCPALVCNAVFPAIANQVGYIFSHLWPVIHISGLHSRPGIWTAYMSHIWDHVTSSGFPYRNQLNTQGRRCCWKTFGVVNPILERNDTDYQSHNTTGINSQTPCWGPLLGSTTLGEP